MYRPLCNPQTNLKNKIRTTINSIFVKCIEEHCSNVAFILFCQYCLQKYNTLIFKKNVFHFQIVTLLITGKYSF